MMLITNGETAPPALAKKLNRPPVSAIWLAGAMSDSSVQAVADAIPWAKKAIEKHNTMSAGWLTQLSTMMIIDRISPLMMGALRAMLVATPRRSNQSDPAPPTRVPTSAHRYGMTARKPAVSR